LILLLYIIPFREHTHLYSFPTRRSSDLWRSPNLHHPNLQRCCEPLLRAQDGKPDDPLPAVRVDRPTRTTGYHSAGGSMMESAAALPEASIGGQGLLGCWFYDGSRLQPGSLKSATERRRSRARWARLPIDSAVWLAPTDVCVVIS